ncbi:toprim domain-containing protein [Metasolibacillus meyeri]|uniref:Toprim domain-containing protein n=1 Tax=Metasolibacillus meyeri TaxID=1071052 RepID=A0AAW9NRJ0_9BACL|nr:toprim domain-containing protein [Metasolibacillus meyeri]MEC1178947.1 toprim domain-containing protein [Metasolibacillus meyeri]
MICMVVEGRSDKLKLEQVIAEEAIILCTNGTMSEDGLLELLAPYEYLSFYTLFDADLSGQKMRKLMRRIYSEAVQLEIPAQYKEVAETPTAILAALLKKENIRTK